MTPDVKPSGVFSVLLDRVGGGGMTSRRLAMTSSGFALTNLSSHDVAGYCSDLEESSHDKVGVCPY